MAFSTKTQRYEAVRSALSSYLPACDPGYGGGICAFLSCCSQALPPEASEWDVLRYASLPAHELRSWIESLPPGEVRMGLEFYPKALGPGVFLEYQQTLRKAAARPQPS
jgi:hypothetical protein